jgi:hypothetical protein
VAPKREGYDHLDIERLFQRMAKASEILKRREPASMEAWTEAEAARKENRARSYH